MQIVQASARPVEYVRTYVRVRTYQATLEVFKFLDYGKHVFENLSVLGVYAKFSSF